MNTHIEVTTKSGNMFLVPRQNLVLQIVQQNDKRYGEVGIAGDNSSVWSVTLDEALRIRNILMGSQK